MWSTELSLTYNPLEALSRAKDQRDAIEGLVPRGGVTWLYGPSMNFKSFLVLSMAAAVASGTEWLGRRVEEGVVVYIGAEGGDAVHVRRAAAEMALGKACPIAVVQERPMLDSAAGALHLRGILSGVTNTYWGEHAWAEARERALDQDGGYAAASEALEAARRWQRECRANRAAAYDTDAAREAVTAARHAYEAEKEGAHATVPGLQAYDAAVERYSDEPLTLKTPLHQNLLVIIDTYAQTAADDSRPAVSAYIKNLRALISEAEAYSVSFVVVDHSTKEGGSYLGSVAKLNDVDSQIEVKRAQGGMVATLSSNKMKDSGDVDEIHAELVPYVFEGFSDGAGRPLETLVVRGATKGPEGNAGALLALLADAGGRMTKATLKEAFLAAKPGVQRASADKAFLRSFRALVAAGLIVVSGDAVTA